ncbi:MAG: hypothetical protein J5449_03085 [Oscillospiraceae bacterium]|nr:hypothetical protein [Oscillospiraceae bacterium]
MNKFFGAIVEVLRQDERFFTEDGELLRNAVVEAAGKMDAHLIKRNISLVNIEKIAKGFGVSISELFNEL